MRRKTDTRRHRKKNGGGCGCGGMEMLGFPKSGGFMGLFGGEEQAKPVETFTQPSKLSMPSETMTQPSALSTPSTLSTPSMLSTPMKPTTMNSLSSMPNSMLEPKPRAMSTDTMMNQTFQKPKNNSGKIVTELKNLKSDVTNIKEQLANMNSSFKTTNSPGLFGGYKATRRNKKYLKMYKKGKSIGFTMRSSLKAKGLIPRANGTYKISKKYRG